MPIQIKKYVREFVHKYLDVTAEQEHAIVDYALDTWQALPPQVKYLHFVGDFATGKTRAGKIMEYICHNPIVARGTSSPRSMAMMIDQSQPCTLILDEADILPEQEPDEDGYVAPNLFETILNVGAMKQTAMIGRMEQEQSEIYKPKFYNVFGYKVIMSRNQFKDPAKASKCIVIRLKEKKRLEIPPVLDGDFTSDGEKIRSLLQQHSEYVTC
jgi:hypothetical protein